MHVKDSGNMISMHPFSFQIVIPLARNLWVYVITVPSLSQNHKLERSRYSSFQLSSDFLTEHENILNSLKLKIASLLPVL